MGAHIHARVLTHSHGLGRVARHSRRSRIPRQVGRAAGPMGLGLRGSPGCRPGRRALATRSWENASGGVRHGGRVGLGKHHTAAEPMKRSMAAAVEVQRELHGRRGCAGRAPAGRIEPWPSCMPRELGVSCWMVMPRRSLTPGDPTRPATENKRSPCGRCGRGRQTSPAFFQDVRTQ